MNNEQKQITDYNELELEGLFARSKSIIEIHQNNLKIIQEEVKRREDLANSKAVVETESKKRGRPAKK